VNAEDEYFEMPPYGFRSSTGNLLLSNKRSTCNRWNTLHLSIFLRELSLLRIDSTHATNYKSGSFQFSDWRPLFGDSYPRFDFNLGLIALSHHSLDGYHGPQNPVIDNASGIIMGSMLALHSKWTS
jgi:hypothetical protein